MKTMEQFIAHNQRQTGKLAKLLAKEILKYKNPKNHALVFGLIGNLGAGKTTFIQYFAKGLGIKNKITSPSFVILKEYKIPFKLISNFQQPISNLYHIDCYRIKNAKDILGLDFQEIVSNPKNIIIIEWAERIRKILPKETIWLKFKIIGKKERKIKIL